MRSKAANSLLAKRCLKTGVRVPPFSEKSAKLHFVPPTSPARITCSPYPILNRFKARCPLLWVVPLPAVTFQEKIGFPGPPGSGWVLWHGSAPSGTPDIKDGVHKRPGSLDAVAAVEERGITAHAIVEESGIRAARSVSKTFAITEIHGDVSDAHFSPWALGPEGDGDAFIRLNVQDEAVGFDLALAKDHMRSAPEFDHDFGGALGETFSCSKIEGDAGPTPIVDQ